MALGFRKDPITQVVTNVHGRDVNLNDVDEQFCRLWSFVDIHLGGRKMSISPQLHKEECHPIVLGCDEGRRCTLHGDIENMMIASLIALLDLTHNCTESWNQLSEGVPPQLTDTMNKFNAVSIDSNHFVANDATDETKCKFLCDNEMKDDKDGDRERMDQEIMSEHNTNKLSSAGNDSQEFGSRAGEQALEQKKNVLLLDDDE